MYVGESLDYIYNMSMDMDIIHKIMISKYKNILNTKPNFTNLWLRVIETFMVMQIVMC